MRQGTQWALCGLLILPYCTVPANAQEESGTDITIGVSEKEPEYANTNIHIKTKHGIPLPDAVVYIENSNGYYLPAAKSDHKGNCQLYLIPGHQIDMMIERYGFIGNHLHIKRSKDKEVDLSYNLTRNGPYQDITEQDVRIQYLKMENRYLVDEAIPFQVVNTDMEDKDPVQGDLRFRPIYWYIVDKDKNTVCEGKFNGIDGTVRLHKEGTYKLVAVLQKELYYEHQWTKEDKSIQKSYELDVYQSDKQQDSTAAKTVSPVDKSDKKESSHRDKQHKVNNNKTPIHQIYSRKKDYRKFFGFGILLTGIMFFLILFLKRRKKEEEEE